MGNSVNNRVIWKDDDFEKRLPNPNKHSTVDPLYGFPNGRKERVMIATKEECDASGIPRHLQDYCAHIHIKYLKCRHENLPYYWRCKHPLHELNTCRHEDHILRMKEHERERRLMERARRLGKVEDSELLVE